MNGFISKYRWIFVILGGGLAIGIAYFGQQDTSPTPVVEVVEVVEQEVADEIAPDAEHPAVIIATQEPESPPSEPDPVEVVEESIVEEIAVEEVVIEETASDSVAADTEEAAATMTDEVTPSAPDVTPVVDPEPVIEVQNEEPAQDQPAAVAEELTEELSEAITVTSDEENTEETTDVTKPSFDVVRVDPTGAAIIAGTAEPFSKVVIRSNGEEIGEAIAGSTGEFVAMTQMPDTEEGQTLNLETEIDGELLFSDDSILILPMLQSDAADAVTEEAAPPIVRATAEEIVVLQGGAQLALGQISLDSISYDENDEVVLAGRGNPGRTIIIYVDNTPLMDTVVSESGSWKQALLGLDAGRYVLRVDEVDEDGTVTSRVESPFQREYPEDVREAKAVNDTTYTVQPGNSLWLIATGRYGDGLRYHQIFSANQDQIRNPDLIYPGQVLAIPEAQE